MPTPGFAGKILRVNLSNREISIIDSSKYEEYGGGYGTAVAIFWDLCVAPGDWDLQDAFDPRNIVCLMTGPLAGTGVPFAARTSVSGLSPQSWPICWFSRSNFGGNFASMLKFAGWDGVVVQGRSESPVYINIIDNKVTIENAKQLWGLDTWTAEQEIYKLQNANTSSLKGRGWRKLGDHYTTQRPSIVAIGPAGENMCRIGSLVHGGGSSAGQGGFGGVFGSKNLKAIAVIGTGSIRIVDPKGLRDARKWFEKTYPMPPAFGPPKPKASCTGCTRGCRTRAEAYGNDSDVCVETNWYNLPLPRPPWGRTSLNDKYKAADIAQKLGINAFDICFGGPMAFIYPGHPIQPAVPAHPGSGWYIKYLYDKGIIGPGKEIDTHPLPMDKYERVEFAEAYATAISNRVGIGDLLAEGICRFAEKIGRLDDLNDILRCPMWGFVDHWTLPGVEWAYGNLVDSRDINNHDMQMRPSMFMSCDDYVKIMAEKTPPYNDPFMFDYSWKDEQAYKTGIYSNHKAKLVAWHQHYQTFYKESVLFCDFAFGSYINFMTPDKRGATPLAEPTFYNAVTGKNLTFVDGIEIGRKAWNLKRAIVIMQGRHRDMEKFAGYMYRPGAAAADFGGDLPIYDGKKWRWVKSSDMYLNDKGVERWKTAFYDIEGWDTRTGYPKRSTLEQLGMKHVADVLQANKRLGSV